MTTEYLIFRVKKDKRFKKGYDPRTFHYIDEADTATAAEEKAKSHKEERYAIGIETITRY